MAYEQLWAPWRLAYLTANRHTGDAAEGCFLCQYHDQPAKDAEQLVVARGERVLLVLNRFPYNNGHLLVAPLAHKGGLAELDDAELLEGDSRLGSVDTAPNAAAEPEPALSV